MKYIRKINESDENTLTWNKIVNDSAVDFIFDRKIIDIKKREDILYDSGVLKAIYLNSYNTPINLNSIGNIWEKGNIKLCINYDAPFVLAFKNGDLMAILFVYGLKQVNLFKEIVVLYGPDNILLYDLQDFTFKNIETR